MIKLMWFQHYRFQIAGLFSLWKFNFTYVSHNYHNYAMFRNVPECSVSDFIDAPRRDIDGFAHRVLWLMFRNVPSSILLSTVMYSTNVYHPRFRDRFRQCVTVFQMFRCRLDHYDHARITLLLNGSIPKKDKRRKVVHGRWILRQRISSDRRACEQKKGYKSVS